jgi:hypothetical protein
MWICAHCDRSIASVNAVMVKGTMLHVECWHIIRDNARARIVLP